MVMLNRDLGLKRFRINRILNENAISRKIEVGAEKMVTVYVVVLGEEGEGEGGRYNPLQNPSPPQKKIIILRQSCLF